MFEGLLAAAEGRGPARRAEPAAGPAEHRATLPDEDARPWRPSRPCSATRRSIRRAWKRSSAKTGTPAADGRRRSLTLLREHGRLVAIEDLLFHREAVDRAREILVAFLRKEGRLESVRFKYLLDTARKYALPLLDYFDRTGVTRRRGQHAVS